MASSITQINEFFQAGVEHHQAGRLQEAEHHYREILSRQPDHAEALHLLGVIAHQVGQNEIAVELIGKAVALAPQAAAFHSNLGEAHRAQGQWDEAIAAYRQAILLKPDYPEAHNNLGAALKDKGQLDEAIAAYRQAIVLKPDYPEAHNNLGAALKDKGQLNEAIAAYRQAIALNPNLAEAYSNLGLALKDGGRFEDAVASFQMAIELNPSLVDTQIECDVALGRLVPVWHIPMMNDRPRNDFYFAALKSAITPDSHVLEIGTGSGLLAMMAATLGAKEVTSCEAVPLIAATAQRIISDNGLAQRIRIIPRKSSDVTVGPDLPELADVLVSEIFSSEFLGEGVLPSIEDAKRRMLKPNSRIIPAAGSIMIALFGGDEFAQNLFVEDSCGFNLRQFNAIVPRHRLFHKIDLKSFKLLSDAIEAFRFDFERDSAFPAQEKILHLPVKTSGRCFGVVQWIRLEMGSELVFENHPLTQSATSGWQHCIYKSVPANLEQGQIAVVSAAHDRQNPWFSLQGVDSSSPS